MPSRAPGIKTVIALSAGFGGISPNLLQIAIDLVKDGKAEYINLGYLIGLSLFAGMGAGIALIWGERDLKRAYYLGLGFPSLIQVALASATQGQVSPVLAPTQVAQVAQVGELQESSPGLSFSFFASPALAEPTVPPEKAHSPQVVPEIKAGSSTEPPKHRQLTLWLEDVPEGAELWFTSPNRQEASRIILDRSSDSDEGSRVDFQVPDFASQAFLRIDTSKSAPMPLQNAEGSATAFRVDVDHSRLGGFLKALGVQNVNTLNFQIDRVARVPAPN